MDATIRELQQRIVAAGADRQALRIVGGGSKDFYGGAAVGAPLSLRAQRGIVAYEPGELSLTARAGTPLAEVESALDDAGQMLAFEPPRFGNDTIGGCVACGLSGPRRPYAGAVRDHVLGVRMLDGRGRLLRFGGQVIKNVAGYDVSRLMVGALGTLGVLLEISFKVLPRPAYEKTLRFEMGEAAAITAVNRWAGCMPSLSATSHCDGVLCVRLSGSEAGVRAAARQLGGEVVTDGAAHWRALRDQTADFFRRADTLWRVSLPPTTVPLACALPQLHEWNGGLRWLSGEANADALRRQAAVLGGHVTRFRGAGAASDGAFHPLPPALQKLHAGLKHVFDPLHILNPGRAYDAPCKPA